MWQLEPHHIEILTHAASCLDRAETARVTVASEGQFLKDRYGCSKENPACKAERDSMAMFARLVRELNLDVDQAEPSRPPLIPGRYKSR